MGMILGLSREKIYTAPLPLCPPMMKEGLSREKIYSQSRCASVWNVFSTAPWRNQTLNKHVHTSEYRGDISQEVTLPCIRPK